MSLCDRVSRAKGASTYSESRYRVNWFIDAIIQAEYFIGRNSFNVRITANQVDNRFLGEIVSPSDVVKVDVVDIGDVVVRRDVQLLAQELPVRFKGVVISQADRPFMWNYTVQMSVELVRIVQL